MAWALQELQLHQQAERQGPEDGLELGPPNEARAPALQVRNKARAHAHTPARFAMPVS